MVIRIVDDGGPATSSVHLHFPGDPHEELHLLRKYSPSAVLSVFFSIPVHFISGVDHFSSVPQIVRLHALPQIVGAIIVLPSRMAVELLLRSDRLPLVSHHFLIATLSLLLTKASLERINSSCSTTPILIIAVSRPVRSLKQPM